MNTPTGLEITGLLHPRVEEVLTPSALQLLARLHRELNGRRLQRLAARTRVADDISTGGTLDFLPETAPMRADGSWRVADPAPTAAPTG